MEIKTIEIAPSRKNTRIRKNMIIGRLSDGSRTYVLDLPKDSTFARKDYKEAKDAFRAAIALASKKWQVEETLSSVFGVECHLTIINGPAHWLDTPKVKFNLCPTENNE